MGGHSKGHHEEELGHVVSDKTFLNVLIILIVLTIITVAVSRVDFGVFNIVVAMVVASIKAALVIGIFMHGLYESKLIWTYIVIPFLLLIIMIGGTFLDDPFRARPEPIVAEKVVL